MPFLTVASFNIHVGTDGWGRPYDLVAACRELDAGVIVMQEVFTPSDGPSQAEDVASELGCDCVELPLVPAWRRRVPIWNGKGWEPRRLPPRRDKALLVGHKSEAVTAGELSGFEEGTWGLAILSSYEIVGSEVVELGRLRKDFTRRAAILVEIEVAGETGSHDFTVVGTHGAHMTAGSPLQFRRLQRRPRRPRWPVGHRRRHEPVGAAPVAPLPWLEESGEGAHLAGVASA